MVNLYKQKIGGRLCCDCKNSLSLWITLVYLLFISTLLPSKIVCNFGLSESNRVKHQSQQNIPLLRQDHFKVSLYEVSALKVWEMELNKVDRCKFTFVQQSLKSRSRSANNFGIVETISWGKGVYFFYFFQKSFWSLRNGLNTANKFRNVGQCVKVGQGQQTTLVLRRGHGVRLCQMYSQRSLSLSNGAKCSGYIYICLCSTEHAK